MSTFIFFAACAVILIIVMSKIPGLEHFVKPIIDLLFTALKVAIENLTAWSIFLLKSLLFSHLDLLKHLLLSDRAIDPSVQVEQDRG